MLPVITDKANNPMQKNVLTVSLPPSKSGIEARPVTVNCDEKMLHDLRSSLSIIAGYSELMLDGLLGNMTEEQREGMSDILNTSRHMQGVIDGVSPPKTPVCP